MKIEAFPKIFAIGSAQTGKLFDNDVEITEKVDGSQIGFGVLDGELYIRSKGSPIFLEDVPKMFKNGVDVIKKFYGEYLDKPKHNTLQYNRIPKNHIALYGMIKEGEVKSQEFVDLYAKELDLETVPTFYVGKVSGKEELKENSERESFLGGPKIEGFVVKNYQQQLLIGGRVIPILMGKYVSESFKEVHIKNWSRENTGRGRWETYKSQFRSEARWLKAIQHLNEKNELEFTPRDIGKLLCEFSKDLEEECQEDIKNFLWNEFGKELLRDAKKGFPEFYKEWLLSRVLT
jgi:hypothetical protein